MTLPPHNVISIASERLERIGARSSGSRERASTRAEPIDTSAPLHPGMTGRISVR